MERFLYEKLIKWKGRSDRKPLILQGARQVGKTYLLELFGKNEFKNVVVLNFEKEPHLKSLFHKDLLPQRIIREIQVQKGKKIFPLETLILFDEIQACPQALTSLKYFCEEAPNYMVASAGSLLGIDLGEASFPVGKVQFLFLYPLNFFEYLNAFNEMELTSYLNSIDQIEPISDTLHQKCLDYLRLYFATGGMPEVISQYRQSEDFEKVREVQLDLLHTYTNDFAKHSGKASSLKIQEAWESLPKQLSKEQKKFRYAEIRKGGRAKDYEEAIRWLKLAGLVYSVSLVKRPEFPLKHFVEPSYFKLIPLDIGLLSALSGLDVQVFFKETDLYKTFKGAFVESYVGSELCSTGVDNLYYWRSENQAEVDYLFEKHSHIFPLEVKSGVSGKLKSLHVYAQKYHPLKIIRISMQNFDHQNHFINCPIYATTLLPKLLSSA